jgi:hypothetical protein
MPVLISAIVLRVLHVLAKCRASYPKVTVLKEKSRVTVVLLQDRHSLQVQCA